MADKMMLCGSIKSLDEIYIENYIAEQKFDGERILLIKKGNNVNMVNRRGILKEDVYVELKEEMQTLNFDFIIDGEVCSVNGLFNDLQRRALLRDPNEISRRRKSIPIVFHIFDLIELDGENKTAISLMERKKLLNEKFGKLNLQTAELTPYVDGKINIEALWSKIKQEQKEGIVLKVKSSGYVFKRSNNWLKYKNFKEIEIEMTSYTLNPAGVKLTDGFNEVQVQGQDRASWIIKKIDAGEKVKVVVQYLEKIVPSGKLRFPSCKEDIGSNE